MAPIFTGSKFGFGGGAGDVVVPFSATGGTIYSDPQYSFYVFTSPGTFSVTSGNSTTDVFLVAGGGGGGTGGDERNPTGGGAGGVVFATIPAPNINAGSYPIVVGPGGTGSITPAGSNWPGPANFSGNPSTFVYGATTITALGGGRGASWRTNGSASPGGSGGGYDPSPYSPNTGGTGNQPTQNPGNPHVLHQWGSPGGGTYGGAAGPGFAPYYAPGSNFGQTLDAVFPATYGRTAGAGGYGAGSGLALPGNAGIVIVRTVKSS
jgi:hypothetical protein